jgi:hypothetical protein
MPEPDPEVYGCRACGRLSVLAVNEDRCPACGAGIDGDPRRDAAPACRCGHSHLNHADNGVGRCRYRLNAVPCEDDCASYASRKPEVWQVTLEMRLDPATNYLPLDEWDWQTLLGMRFVRALATTRTR